MRELGLHLCFDRSAKTAYNPGMAAESHPRTSRLERTVPLAIALIALLCRAYVAWRTHSTTEDFLITLRYAENLASGRGFVYNEGERVMGATTPLYTLLLAASAWFGLGAAAVGKTLNVLTDAATCLLICRLALAVGRPRAGWLAALLYATASAPINFSVGGMETGLVTACCMLAVVCFAEGKLLQLAVASALLIHLRIDGAVLIGVLWAGVALKDRRVPWREIAFLALLVLPVFAAEWLYFGSPIPASITAKLAVYARIRGGTLPNLGDFQHHFAGGLVQKALLCLFLAGAVISFEQIRALRAPLIWLLVYYAAMLMSRVPAFGWYFVPPMPLYFLAVAISPGALLRLCARVLRQERRLTSQRLAAGALACLAVPLVWHVRSVAADVARAQRLEDEVRRPLGEWLRANTKPTDRIMLEPIGYIGYYSKRRVLDIIGLVSPEVLPYYRPEVDHPVGEIVAHFKPSVLVLRASEKDEIESYSKRAGGDVLRADYQSIGTWPQAGPDPIFYLYRRVD